MSSIAAFSSTLRALLLGLLALRAAAFALTTRALFARFVLNELAARAAYDVALFGVTGDVTFELRVAGVAQGGDREVAIEFAALAHAAAGPTALVLWRHFPRGTGEHALAVARTRLFAVFGARLARFSNGRI